jgi:hypothetical protein
MTIKVFSFSGSFTDKDIYLPEFKEHATNIVVSEKEEHLLISSLSKPPSSSLME